MLSQAVTESDTASPAFPTACDSMPVWLQNCRPWLRAERFTDGNVVSHKLNERWYFGVPIAGDYTCGHRGIAMSLPRARSQLNWPPPNGGLHHSPCVQTFA